MHAEACIRRAEVVADASDRESWLKLASVWMLAQQSLKRSVGSELRSKVVPFHRR